MRVDAGDIAIEYVLLAISKVTECLTQLSFCGIWYLPVRIALINSAVKRLDKSPEDVDVDTCKSVPIGNSKTGCLV